MTERLVTDQVQFTRQVGWRLVKKKCVALVKQRTRGLCALITDQMRTTSHPYGISAK